MRWRYVSDDDSQRQVVKCNGFLSVGQRKLTVTVCPSVRQSAGLVSWSAMRRL